MRGAQRGLRRADLARRRLEARGRDGALRKILVQAALLRDQPRADRDRLGLHGGEQRAQARDLVRRQVEAVGQLDRVHRTRIAVQLGGEREPHAAAGIEIGDLLLGQRLDRTRLEAGIGLLRQRRCAGDEKRNDRHSHDRLR